MNSNSNQDLSGFSDAELNESYEKVDGQQRRKQQEVAQPHLQTDVTFLQLKPQQKKNSEDEETQAPHSQESQSLNQNIQQVLSCNSSHNEEGDNEYTEQEEEEEEGGRFTSFNSSLNIPIPLKSKSKKVQNHNSSNNNSDIQNHSFSSNVSDSSKEHSFEIDEEVREKLQKREEEELERHLLKQTLRAHQQEAKKLISVIHEQLGKQEEQNEENLQYKNSKQKLLDELMIEQLSRFLQHNHISLTEQPFLERNIELLQLYKREMKMKELKSQQKHFALKERDLECKEILLEKKRVENELSRLQHELNECHKEMKSTQQRYQESRGEFEQVSAKLCATDQEREALKSQMKKVNADRDEILQQNVDKNIEIQNLKVLQLDSLKEYSAVLEEIKELQRQLAESEEQIDQEFCENLKLQQSVAQKNEKIYDLNGKLKDAILNQERVYCENDELKTIIDDISQELDGLKRQQQQLEENAQNAEDEKNYVQLTASLQEEEIMHLNREVSQLEKSLQEVKDKLSSKNVLVLEMKEREELQTREAEELQMCNAELQNTVHNLQNTVHEKDQQIAQLLKEKKLAQEAQKEEYHKYIEEIAGIELDFQNEKSCLTFEKERLEAKLHELKAQMETQHQQLQKELSQQFLQEKEQLSKDYESKIQQQSIDFANVLDEQLQSLTERLEDVCKNSDEKNAKINDLENELEHITSEMDTLSDYYKQEIDTLIAAKKQILIQKEQEIELLQDQLESASKEHCQEIDNLKNGESQQIMELYDTVEHLKLQILELEGQLQEQNEEIQLLKMGNKYTEESEQDARKKYAELATVLEKKQKEVDNLRDSLDCSAREFTEEIKRQTLKRQTLEEKLTLSEQKLKEQKLLHNELVQDKLKAQEKYSQLRDKLFSVQEKVQSFNEEQKKYYLPLCPIPTACLGNFKESDFDNYIPKSASSPSLSLQQQQQPLQQLQPPISPIFKSLQLRSPPQPTFEGQLMNQTQQQKLQQQFHLQKKQE